MLFLSDETTYWWVWYQEDLEACQLGGIIIPVIVSSDKTQLMLFRDKMAYLIYLIIGNISKDICWKPSHYAQILIGYILTTKLASIKNKSARHHALANLFYAYMQKILGPIGPTSENEVAMMSRDGVWCWCHPIFIIFIGDYPKQALVTCTFNRQCSKCLVPPGQLGKYNLFLLFTQRSVIDIYHLADDDLCKFYRLAAKPSWSPFSIPSEPVSHLLTSLFQSYQISFISCFRAWWSTWLAGLSASLGLQWSTHDAGPFHLITTLSFLQMALHYYLMPLAKSTRRYAPFFLG